VFLYLFLDASDSVVNHTVFGVKENAVKKDGENSLTVSCFDIVGFTSGVTDGQTDKQTYIVTVVQWRIRDLHRNVYRNACLKGRERMAGSWDR